MDTKSGGTKPGHGGTKDTGGGFGKVEKGERGAQVPLRDVTNSRPAPSNPNKGGSKGGEKK